MKVRLKELCPHPDALWTERPLTTAHLDLHPTGTREAPIWSLSLRHSAETIGEIALATNGREGTFVPSIEAAFVFCMEEAIRRLMRLCFEVLGLEQLRIDPHSGVSLPLSLTFPLTKDAWQRLHAARPVLLVVAVALVDREGKILLTRRPPGKTMEGLWEFPGGKLDEKETPEQALIRELKEELGITVGANCLSPVTFASHDYDTFHLLMPLYLCRNWWGTPEAREKQTLAWVAKENLQTYPMPPADLPLIAPLKERL